MHFKISPAMMTSMSASIFTAKQVGKVLDVYKTAEAIRQMHKSDNVALEDVVEALVLLAGSSLAMMFDSKSLDVLEIVDTDLSERYDFQTAQHCNGKLVEAI